MTSVCRLTISQRGSIRLARVRTVRLSMGLGTASFLASHLAVSRRRRPNGSHQKVATHRRLHPQVGPRLPAAAVVNCEPRVVLDSLPLEAHTTRTSVHISTRR